MHRLKKLGGDRMNEIYGAGLIFFFSLTDVSF